MNSRGFRLFRVADRALRGYFTNVGLRGLWKRHRLRLLGWLGGVCTLGYAIPVAARLLPQSLSMKEADAADEQDEKPRKPLTSRERRFLTFASLEYNDQIYMTPRDFLDSVTQDQPRHRVRRKPLEQEDVERLLAKTPPVAHNSKSLLRTVDTQGLVSFTEYLFLLSVLTKPKSGFRIAFDMFDADDNHRVDKEEFLVIQALTLMLREGGKIARLNYYKKRKETRKESVQEVAARQDTTLLRHLFGPRGNGMLTYEQFARFNENLQSEVLEIEFAEFSRGKRTISEMDFAKILLRYTVVHLDDYRQYMQRVEQRIPEETGITFDQFRQFCQFLNNLDDFSIAIKLYTFADQPVSQEEFARAVKISTGFALDAHVVDTVFKIFDVNNDGELSYAEFIAVMKDRIHRGLRVSMRRFNKRVGGG